jgi:hypothetical protein
MNRWCCGAAVSRRFAAAKDAGSLPLWANAQGIEVTREESLAAIPQASPNVNNRSLNILYSSSRRGRV